MALEIVTCAQGTCKGPGLRGFFNLSYNGLSAQAGEPLNVEAWPIYHFKAVILRNMHLEFGGLLLSSFFQKIVQKFYFEDLTDKLFVEWKFKTIFIFLRILPLKWYIGHDSTSSGSPNWTDKRSPGISIVTWWITEEVRAKTQIKEPS